MKNDFTRRNLIGGMGAVAGAAAFGVPDQQAQASASIDFSDPVANLETYIKLLGNLDGGSVHISYSGTIYGVMPDDSQPLVGYAGLVKGVWRQLEEHAYLYRIFDDGHFTDLETGLPLDEFENPFTGKTNRPVHFRGGPFETVHRPGIRDWIRHGDDVWHEQHLGTTYANKLDPDEWPMASTGKTVRVRYVESFNGRLSELADEDVRSARCAFSTNHVTPWAPFFLMGRQPGFTFWSGHGTKIRDFSEIQESTLRYLERTNPEYLESDAPWVTRTDSYLEYKNARQPIKP